MIRRLFVNDRLFSVLLMILFVSVFLIMFYGLDLYYQFSKIQENVDNIKYKEEYDYGIRFEGDMLLKNGKVPFGKGNIILRGEFPIGNSILNQDMVDILWEQNEPILEKISYNKGFSLDSIDKPSCILGDVWRKSIKEREDGGFIDILGMEFRVIGYFEPLMIDESDDRVLILGDSLSNIELYNIAGFDCNIFVYKSISFSNIMKDFEEWIRNYSLEENINYRMNKDMVLDSIIIEAKTYNGYAKKIFAALSAFCIINMFYLSYVWGKKKQKSLMIKKIFGYNMIYIAKDMLGEIGLLELFSLIVSFMITFVYEVFLGDLKEWGAIIFKGMPIVVIIVFGMGLINIFSQLLWVLRSQPVDVLKTNE